jgi:hypothetical protein
MPVAADGTLPVQLFDRPLNFKRIKEKGIHWQICFAEKDDLVEKEAALAPLDWVEAEVTMFPKGHVAMATSWSLPTSECSLHSCFMDRRGPVRYQLDLEKAMESAVPPEAAAKPSELAKAANKPSRPKMTAKSMAPVPKPSEPAKPAAKPSKPRASVSKASEPAAPPVNSPATPDTKPSDPPTPTTKPAEPAKPDSKE